MMNEKCIEYSNFNQKYIIVFKLISIGKITYVIQ